MSHKVPCQQAPPNCSHSYHISFNWPSQPSRSTIRHSSRLCANQRLCLQILSLVTSISKSLQQSRQRPHDQVPLLHVCCGLLGCWQLLQQAVPYGRLLLLLLQHMTRQLSLQQHSTQHTTPPYYIGGQGPAPPHIMFVLSTMTPHALVVVCIHCCCQLAVYSQHLVCSCSNFYIPSHCCINPPASFQSCRFC